MKRGDPNAPFLAAARGQKPAHRPLWIMRQAGRYLPEYREVRSNLKFLDLCNTPEAACEVTMQPIRRYGMDAAILFTDLLVPVPPMGIGLTYNPGPVLERTVATMDDIEGLTVPDPEADLRPMLDTVKLVREQLDESKALIGFVGAPFTMACYLTEGRGSKNWDLTRTMLHQQPQAFTALLEKIAACMNPLVESLIAAGCDAVQVFDSWASVLSAEDWAQHCAPHTDRLLQTARDHGAVAIHYVNGAAQHIDRMAQSPAHVLAVDWRLPLAEVRRRAGPDYSLQGNLDPTALFSDEATLRRKVAAICENGGNRHIFNLGHGILPKTDPEALATVVSQVRQS